jgi:hypothetical protein
VHERSARRAIDDERPQIDELAARRAASQHGPDPGDELLVDERPREIVVAPLERAHLRVGVCASEHDDRAVGDAAAVELLRIAEHEHVRLRRARKVDGARKREHVEAVAAQLPLEVAAHRRLAFCQEERRHAHDRRRVRVRAPDVLSRGSVTSRLQASGADDAPEQPDPEQRREGEADDGDHVHAEHLWAAR